MNKQQVKRGSFLYKILRTIDVFWRHLDGFVDDFEQLDWVYEQRPLFSKEGLIKDDLSLIPFRDRKFGQIVRDYGGWKAITKEDFVPSEELYEKLESIGFGREQFDLSRRYLANPSEYKTQALKRKYPK